MQYAGKSRALLLLAAAATVWAACDTRSATNSGSWRSCPNTVPTDQAPCDLEGTTCHYFAGCADYVPAHCMNGSWTIEACTAAGGTGGKSGTAGAGGTGTGGTGAGGTGTGGTGAGGTGTGGTGTGGTGTGGTGTGGTGAGGTGTGGAGG